MNLQVNGEIKDYPAGLSVAQLLESLALKPEQIIVELNLEILSSEDYGQTILQNDDEVELIVFMGGGA